jgi:hypothetical protein
LAQLPNRDTFGGGKLSFRLGVTLVQPLPGAASHGIAPETDTLFHGHFTREIWMSGNTSPVTRSTEIQSSIMPIPQTYQPPVQNILSLQQNLTGEAGPLAAFSLPNYGRRFLITADGLPSNTLNPQLPNFNTCARFLDVTNAGAEFAVAGRTPEIDTRILESIDDDNYVADVDYKIQYYYPSGSPPASQAYLVVFVLMSNNGIASFRYRTPWPVPVELSSFTATWVNNAVQLRWHVESETNALLFRVERGATKDGRWETVGTVAARGTTTIPSWYTFTDTDPGFTGTVDKLWYRLVEVDMDGSQNTFPAVSVQRDAAPDAFTLNLFPQPLSPGVNDLQMYCETPIARQVTLAVYDVLGRSVVDPIQRELQAGSSILAIGNVTLRPGMYTLLALFDDGTRHVRRLIVR